MTLTRQNDDAPPTLCQMKLELPKFSNTCSLLPHLISPGSKFHIMASVALLVSVPRASKYKPKKKNHKREIRQKTSRLLKSMDMPVMLIGYFTFKIKNVFRSCGNRVCLEAVKMTLWVVEATTE